MASVPRLADSFAAGREPRSSLATKRASDVRPTSRARRPVPRRASKFGRNDSRGSSSACGDASTGITRKYRCYGVLISYLCRSSPTRDSPGAERELPRDRERGRPRRRLHLRSVAFLATAPPRPGIFFRRSSRLPLRSATQRLLSTSRVPRLHTSTAVRQLRVGTRLDTNRVTRPPPD